LLRLEEAKRGRFAYMAGVPRCFLQKRVLKPIFLIQFFKLARNKRLDAYGV